MTRYFLWETTSGKVLSVVAGLDLFLMMMITGLDVIGRYFFNAPLKGSYELTEIMMGISVFAILPTLCAKDDHVSIGLLDGLLRGAAMRAKALITSLISLVFMVLVCWRIWIEAFEHFRYGDATAYLRIPITPVVVFMAVMASVTVIAILAYMVDIATGAMVADKKGKQNL